MIKKILITGSSGQIGSCLVEHFNRKYDIVGLDIKKSGIKEIDKVTTLGDIRDKNLVSKLVKDVDAVIHTAAQLSIKRSLEDPILDADINIMGTLNLLDSSRKNGNVSKFVFFSSSVVYGNPKYLPIDEKHPLDPVSPYGLSKLTGEKYCNLFYKEFGLPTVCVRPFNVYGNREDPNNSYVSIVSKFSHMVRNNKPLIIYGDGKHMRDFVHIEDVAAFTEILLEKSETTGEVYNLGSGNPSTVIDIAKLVLKMNNKSENGNIIFEKSEIGKIEHSYAEIKKSVMIGYKPKITIEEGIRQSIDFYKNN